MGNFMIKLWLWIKKYWKIFALIIGAVVGYVLFRGQNISFAEDFKKIQQTHEDELKKIDEARVEERLKSEQNFVRLKGALKVVEDEYAKQRVELDSKKKKEIKQIVEEAGDDPAALAVKLSEATGFIIIMPEE